jgi:hypothetical protein
VDAARINISPRFVVDEDGQPKEVLLSLAEFERLMEVVEDYLDAQTLDEAIETAESFTPLDDVIAELKREKPL